MYFKLFLYDELKNVIYCGGGGRIGGGINGGGGTSPLGGIGICGVI
jgi:hypothetical protein